MGEPATVINFDDAKKTKLSFTAINRLPWNHKDYHYIVNYKTAGILRHIEQSADKNDNYSIQVNLANLKKFTGLSDQIIKTAIKNLVKDELIIKVPQPSIKGKKQSNKYYLNLMHDLYSNLTKVTNQGTNQRTNQGSGQLPEGIENDLNQRTNQGTNQGDQPILTTDIINNNNNNSKKTPIIPSGDSKPEKPKKPTVKIPGIEPWFEAIWNSYGYKKPKGNKIKSWEKMQDWLKLYNPEQITRGVTAYMKECKDYDRFSMGLQVLLGPQKHVQQYIDSPDDSAPAVKDTNNQLGFNAEAYGWTSAEEYYAARPNDNDKEW